MAIWCRLALPRLSSLSSTRGGCVFAVFAAAANRLERLQSFAAGTKLYASRRRKFAACFGGREKWADFRGAAARKPRNFLLKEKFWALVKKTKFAVRGAAAFALSSRKLIDVNSIIDS